MAAVTAINTTAYGFETPSGSMTRLSTGSEVRSCKVACGFTGAYVQGANAFSFTGVDALISNVNHEGKTIALLGAVFSGLGQEGLTVTGAKAVTLSGTTVIQGQLYGADLTTEHAAGAMGVYAAPIVFHVTYTVT